MPCEEFDSPPISDFYSKSRHFGVFVQHLKCMGYHIPQFDDTLHFYCLDEEVEPDGKDFEYNNYLSNLQETYPDSDVDEYDLTNMDDL